MMVLPGLYFQVFRHYISNMQLLTTRIMLMSIFKSSIGHFSFMRSQPPDEESEQSVLK